MHYQGQTVRSFGKEVFAVPMTDNQIKSRIVIRLSGLTVLRRRVDGKVQCHPDSEEDDARFQDFVMKRIECLPPYWKYLDNSSFHFKPCNSVDQLKRAYPDSNYKNVGRILGKLDPPCEEFSVTSSADSRGNGNLQLTFQYRSDQYLEIRNMRDFGFISLWSSVGGLVGIFLGFSMFQMSEVMLMRVYELFTHKTQLQVTNQ